MSVAGILLAAGESRRMRRAKALLPWGDARSLLEYQLEQLRDVECDQLVVVWGAEPEVASRARELGVLAVENPSWREGRASSTRAGAWAARSDAETVLVVSVDQPAPAAILHALLEKARANPESICVPVNNGRRGHPVALPGRYLTDLREVREETLGLHALVEAHPPAEVDVDDPIVIADINTPDDYERLHEQVFGRKPPVA